MDISRTNREARAQALQRTLDAKYPDLTVGCVGGKIHVRGSFPIVHDSRILDRYQIEIEWSESNREMPVLRETAGRIPWLTDRHMSTGGEACACVPEDWLIRPVEQRTLLHYLDGPVRDFFLWQSIYERGQSLPWKARAHFGPGLLEAYRDMLGVEGEPTIRRYLDCLSRKKIKAHWPCPCGSGKQIRNCHLAEIRKLQSRIPRRVAISALKRLAATPETIHRRQSALPGAAARSIVL